MSELTYLCDCPTKDALVCKQNPECRPSYCKLNKFDQLQMSAHPKLTNRQAQILALLVRGHSVGDIGRELCRSVKTISTHVHRIKLKLNITSRDQWFRFLVSQAHNVQQQQ